MILILVLIGLGLVVSGFGLGLAFFGLGLGVELCGLVNITDDINHCEQSALNCKR